MSKIYVTGDTHGKLKPVVSFCKNNGLREDDTVIILGDAGINYWLDDRDHWTKNTADKAKTTLFCLHGNHEARPCEALGYEKREFHGGDVWVEPAHPRIVFAIDGEVYDFNGIKCLVIGGAYSVDKWHRLATGGKWWPDEQPSDEVKAKVEGVLDKLGWKIDVVLSHTCPFSREPTEAFLSGLDQSTVDDSTERWLDMIERKLSYKKWYCGHFHIDKTIDKLRFLFNDFTELED